MRHSLWTLWVGTDCLHTGQMVKLMGVRKSWARRIPLADFDFRLFGTAISVTSWFEPRRAVGARRPGDTQPRERPDGCVVVSNSLQMRRSHSIRIRDHRLSRNTTRILPSLGVQFPDIIQSVEWVGLWRIRRGSGNVMDSRPLIEISIGGNTPTGLTDTPEIQFRAILNGKPCRVKCSDFVAGRNERKRADRAEVDGPPTAGGPRESRQRSLLAASARARISDLR